MVQVTRAQEHAGMFAQQGTRHLTREILTVFQVLTVMLNKRLRPAALVCIARGDLCWDS